jgi:hypothetical protein
LIAMGGQIIEDTIVVVLEQRNTEADKNDAFQRLEAQGRQTAPEGSRRAWAINYSKAKPSEGGREARRSGDPGLSGILCARRVASSRLNEPFVEHDRELGLCLEPLARRHFPLSCGLAQDEIQELRRGVIGWEMTSRAHGAA